MTISRRLADSPGTTADVQRNGCREARGHTTPIDELQHAIATATDAELIAAAEKHPRVLVEVFDRHAPTLLRYLTGRVGAAEAEHLLGDVFVIALRQRAHIEPTDASVRPYLFGIASNVLARRHRDETRHLRALARTESARPHCVEDAATRADSERTIPQLAGALANLATGDRDVLMLTAWAELDSEEVATALDIPVATVTSRLQRALHRLRDQIDTARQRTLARAR